MVFCYSPPVSKNAPIAGAILGSTCFLALGIYILARGHIGFRHTNIEAAGTSAYLLAGGFIAFAAAGLLHAWSRRGTISPRVGHAVFGLSLVLMLSAIVLAIFESP